MSSANVLTETIRDRLPDLKGGSNAMTGLPEGPLKGKSEPSMLPETAQSAASSSDSNQGEAPQTPSLLQLELDIPAMSDSMGFSDLFPWMKQETSNDLAQAFSPSLSKISPGLFPGKPASLLESAQNAESDMLSHLIHHPMPNLPRQIPSASPSSPQAAHPHWQQHAYQPPAHRHEDPIWQDDTSNNSGRVHEDLDRDQTIPPTTVFDAAAIHIAHGRDRTVTSNRTVTRKGQDPENRASVEPCPLIPAKSPTSLHTQPGFDASAPASEASFRLNDAAPAGAHASHFDFDSDSDSHPSTSDTSPTGPPGQDHLSLLESLSATHSIHSQSLPGDIEPVGQVRIADSYTRTETELDNIDTRPSTHLSASTHLSVRDRRSIMRSVIGLRIEDQAARFDIFADDKLPGYQIWQQEPRYRLAVLARIPKQLVGWKAVLMRADVTADSGAATTTPSMDSSKQFKRNKHASKVLGKQAWEVRSEPLKNSWDFRLGSGIFATMHAGHRLFKHDWIIIVKDGARYVWRMNKTELALFRESDDQKVAEYSKAIPSSTAMRIARLGVPDEETRIGSLVYYGLESGDRTASSPSSSPAIFDADLAIASLLAIFAARGGHHAVTANFELSSDPLRQMLMQKQQETLDREDIMAPLRRPGFARETESVLSNTTDEDADEHSPAAPSAPIARPSARPTQHFGTSGEEPGSIKASRKRFSSFLGRGAQTSNKDSSKKTSSPAETGGKLTPSQRIANHYRSKSSLMF